MIGVCFYSGYPASSGIARRLDDPAGAVKLMASKVRFLANLVIARIRLIWQKWRQIYRRRNSLRTNRPE
jgi:hypothetical protein